jgi:hypothetical protein
MDMIGSGEIALGAVERGNLSAVLTAVHRGGFGNVTRVLDPQRGEIGGQLRRAGVAAPTEFALGEERVAVVINATARTAAALDLLRRVGADAVWPAARIGAAVPPTFGELAARSRHRPAPADTLAD